MAPLNLKSNKSTSYNYHQPNSSSYYSNFSKKYSTQTLANSSTADDFKMDYQESRIFSIHAENVSKTIMTYILDFLEMHGKDAMNHIEKPFHNK